ncbi:MAG TPA: hypothetical protein VIX91_11030 [Candidatus Acidoferrum sp.]
MNSATSVHPSPWYYLLAVPFFVVGAGFFVYTLLHGFLHLTDSLAQVVVPGEAELTLKQGQPYTIFFEQQSVVNGKIFSTNESLNGLQCKVTALSNEQDIPMSRPSMSTTYNLGGRSGRSILGFHVPADGQYKFACGYSEDAHGPEAVLAVGAGVGEKIFSMVVRSLGAIFGGVGSAVIVFLIVLALRERAKQRLIPASPIQS